MLIDLDADRPFPAAPDRPAVLIPVPDQAGQDGAPLALETAASVADHTPPTADVILLAAPSVLLALRAAGPAPDRDVYLLASAEDAEPVTALARALAVVQGRDVALVAAGVRVAAGWLDGLAAAARSDTAAASATPLSLGPGGADIGCPDIGAVRLDELAAAVARDSQLRRPRVASFGTACLYLTREALEAHGPVHAERGELGAALEDLAHRISASGLLHLVADDVLVDARAAPAPGSGERPEAVAADEGGPLRRVLALARLHVKPLSVTIDARALVSAYGGTQTYLLGLIRALGETDGVVTRVLAAHDLSGQAEAMMRPLGVEIVSYEQAVAGVGLDDVVHRPQQVFTVDDLNLLRLVGERIVIGQQDLIAYHASSYHAAPDAWRAYRRVTRIALAVADQAVFFSEHARDDALSEELIGPERTAVAGIGPPADETGGERVRPAGLEGDRPFLLCLGADYAHKNRPFAIELQAALGRRGWPGRLVLAGTHVERGSSAARERELLDSDAALRQSVLDLGPVGDSERRWLLAGAAALVYPTFYEGFGLIPAEAAGWGLPCLFAAGTALAERMRAAATLVPWNADASAEATLGLLVEGPARDAHLRLLRAIPEPPWPEVAAELVAVYRRAVASPRRPGAASAWQELERERVIGELSELAQEYQDAYHQLERRVELGLPLIDEGGLLSAAQQRGLMRVAARRGGRAALAPFELLGRVGDEGEDA